MQYGRRLGKSVVLEPGVLDSEEDFIDELKPPSPARDAEEGPPPYTVCVLSVLLLALLLDGDIGGSERKLWRRAVEAVCVRPPTSSFVHTTS